MLSCDGNLSVLLAGLGGGNKTVSTSVKSLTSLVWLGLALSPVPQPAILHVHLQPEGRVPQWTVSHWGGASWSCVRQSCL